jgi:hypothetical protein
MDNVRYSQTLQIKCSDPRSIHAPRSINQRESERKESRRLVQAHASLSPYYVLAERTASQQLIFAPPEILCGSKKRDLIKEIAPDAPPAQPQGSSPVKHLAAPIRRSAITHVSNILELETANRKESNFSALLNRELLQQVPRAGPGDDELHLVAEVPVQQPRLIAGVIDRDLLPPRPPSPAAATRLPDPPEADGGDGAAEQRQPEERQRQDHRDQPQRQRRRGHRPPRRRQRRHHAAAAAHPAG